MADPELNPLPSAPQDWAALGHIQSVLDRLDLTARALGADPKAGGWQDVSRQLQAVPPTLLKDAADLLCVHALGFDKEQVAVGPAGTAGHASDPLTPPPPPPANITTAAIETFLPTVSFAELAERLKRFAELLPGLRGVIGLSDDVVWRVPYPSVVPVEPSHRVRFIESYRDLLAYSIDTAPLLSLLLEAGTSLHVAVLQPHDQSAPKAAGETLATFYIARRDGGKPSLEAIYTPPGRIVSRDTQGLIDRAAPIIIEAIQAMADRIRPADRSATANEGQAEKGEVAGSSPDDSDIAEVVFDAMRQVLRSDLSGHDPASLKTIISERAKVLSSDEARTPRAREIRKVETIIAGLARIAALASSASDTPEVMR